MRVPIAYAIDDIYVEPLLAQLVALYEHAKESTIYDLYILHRHLSSKNKERIRQWVESLKPEAHVGFLYVEDSLDKEVPSIGSWGKETNYRGLLPTLAPDLAGILYLDADTLVLEDLSHLMEIDLTGHPFGASIDPFTDVHRLLSIAQLEDNRKIATMVLHYGYINAGVLLMNLAYWREYGWQAEFLRLLNLLHDKKIPCLPDQDVLNYLAIREGINTIYYLPSTYNSLFTHTHIPSAKENAVDVSEDFPITKLRERALIALRNRNIVKPDPRLIFDRVVIVHFCDLKPWNRSRGNDSFVPLFKPYADRVGLEIPSRDRKLPRFVSVKKKVRQYRKIIIWGVSLNMLLVLLLSYLISLFW